MKNWKVFRQKSTSSWKTKTVEDEFVDDVFTLMLLVHKQICLCVLHLFERILKVVASLIIISYKKSISSYLPVLNVIYQI